MESEVKICASYLVLCGLPALLFVNDFLMIKCEETTTDLFLNIMDKNMREKAMVDVVVLRKRNGSLAPTDTIQLTGIFSSAGTINNAKGYLRHIRLCTESNDSVWSRFEYMPWIAIFTLQENDEDIHNPFCFPPIDKVNMAIAKGAEAVIVDVTENEAAAKQFKKLQGPVSTKPIVIIRGKEAGQLRKAMLLDVEAIGKIQSSAPVDREKSNHETDSHRDYYTISIFLGTLLVLSLISIAAILKFKGRWNKKEPCATQIAKRVLKSMETRKFNFSDHWFVTESCAVCLEEYIPGQEVRILPCRHEFHKSCVDGWLINRRTCPLCLSNILDRPNSSRDGYIYTSKQPSCSAGYRRRYDVIDDASDADQLGYRQDYYHGDSFVGGYIGDGGGLDAVVGGFEHGIGFSTQAIITDYPQQQQQQQQQQSQQDFVYRGHHLGIIESQGYYHADDPDSADEVGATCRASFGFDRASARERHRRFSGRRSISSSSYWSGGSRSTKSRRSVIPEYSRLRIKQRSSPSSEQPPSSFEKTPPILGPHAPPPAPPPMLHSATAQQLQVLPQQHAVQSSSPVQTNQTTFPEQQSSTTLPRCKKLELASSNHGKKKRPPCCSLDDEDEFIWRSSSTFSTVLALNSGSYRSAIKSGCLGKFGDGSYHLKEEGVGKMKTNGVTDVHNLTINDRSKPAKYQNDPTKFAQFPQVAGQSCGKSQNVENSSHYHTLPSRRFHHHHRHYSKCYQHNEDDVITEFTIQNTRTSDAAEEGRTEESKTSKKRSLLECQGHDKYHKSNLIQSCQPSKRFDKFSPAKKEDSDSKRCEDPDNKGEHLQALAVGVKESSKFDGKGASPKVVSISKQPIFIDDRLQCSHPSHYHRRSPQFKVTNLSSVTSTTGASFASPVPFQSSSSTTTSSSSSLTLQSHSKHFTPRPASPHTSNVMLPLSVQTIHRAQRFFVAPSLKPSLSSRFNSSIMPSTSLSSRKPQPIPKDEPSSSSADPTAMSKCNKMSKEVTKNNFLERD